MSKEFLCSLIELCLWSTQSVFNLQISRDPFALLGERILVQLEVLASTHLQKPVLKVYGGFMEANNDLNITMTPTEGWHLSVSENIWVSGNITNNEEQEMRGKCAHHQFTIEAWSLGKSSEMVCTPHNSKYSNYLVESFLRLGDHLRISSLKLCSYTRVIKIFNSALHLDLIGLNEWVLFELLSACLTYKNFEVSCLLRRGFMGSRWIRWGSKWEFSKRKSLRRYFFGWCAKKLCQSSGDWHFTCKSRTTQIICFARVWRSRFGTSHHSDNTTVDSQ